MSLGKKHYSVWEAQAPTGVTTAACRSCMACGDLLTGSGGGGHHWLCEPCVEALRRGCWRGNLRRLRDASKEDRLAMVELLRKETP